MTNSTAANVEAFLRAHNFKQTGQNWRGNTPGKLGSDSQACVVTIEGPENGAYINFSTGDSGSLYDFCAANGIAKSERVAVENTKRAYRDLADYATAHGAPVEAFTAARWVTQTCDGRPALAFDTENGTRYRFLDGEKPPYKSPHGYESCWYGLKRAVNMAGKTSDPLVLVNGEASTVVCHYHGIPAACVTSGGERKLSDGLLKELRAVWSGRIVIAFDCDATGKASAEQLRAQLTDYAVAVVDFGLGDGGDAADWCKLHTSQAMAELQKRVTFSAKAQPLEAAPKYMRNADLMRQRRTFHEKVQSGQAMMTLSTGIEQWDRALMGGMWTGLNFLAGAMGSGKSTLAASIVAHWTKQGKRGMIFTTEMTPGQWVDRVWAHLACLRTDELSINFNPAFRPAFNTAYDLLEKAEHIWRVDGMPTVAGIREDILRGVANKEVDFVVVDSSSNMHADGVSGSIFDQTKAVTNQLAKLSTEVQAIVGDAVPIPFVVTHQTNANNVLKRANKVATMLDAYGGQSPAQDATTYTVINYLSWFVERGLAEPDPDYPPGVAALIVDKHRYFSNSSDRPARVRFVPGMGFYGDNVPGRVEKRPDTRLTPRIMPAPRQYKDDEDALEHLYASASDRVADIIF